MKSTPAISVIIPCLNEVHNLGRTLAAVRAGGPEHQIIIADGGSTDGTLELARDLGGRCDLTLLSTPPGRAKQMNTAAGVARGEVLVFVHADTILPPAWPDHVRATLTLPGTAAGAFRFKVDRPTPGLRIIEATTAFRCRVFQAPYGDQAIFLQADTFREQGGWPEVFMEDFHLLRRLKKVGRIRIAPAPAPTSARRWQRAGTWRVTWVHQLMVAGGMLGISPTTLKRLHAHWA